MLMPNDPLKQVYETGFALDDILLYLDTHPTDQEALNYYNYVRNAHQEAVKAYERDHGPLTVDQVHSGDWNWVSNPWPWEGRTQACGTMRNDCNTR